MNFDHPAKRLEQTIALLMEQGWKRSDILVEPSYSVDGKLYQPDLILLYNNYPIAVIELLNISNSDSLADAEAQSEYYLEHIDLPFAYVIGPQQVIEIQPKLDLSVTHKTFPSPDTLLKKLNIDASNPLVIPLPQMQEVAPRLHQVFAIRNVIDAVMKNQKRVLLSIAAGGGGTYVQAQIVGKLLQSGQYKRCLYLGDRLILLEQTQKVFQQWGLATQRIDNLADRELGKDIYFQTIQSLSRGAKKPDFSIYDLVILNDASLALKMSSFHESLSHATIIGYTSLVHFSPKFREFYGDFAYIYSFQDTLSAEDMKPPEGHIKVQLSDIGEIVTGVPYKSEYFVEKTHSEDLFVLLRGKDIDGNGKINLASAVGIRTNIDAHFIKDGQLQERYQLQKGDILIQSTASGNHWNIAILDKNISFPTTFSSSLIKIRINPNSARAEDVFRYLRSPDGQEMLRRLAIRGTSIPRITPRDLVNLPIYLPDLRTQLEFDIQPQKIVLRTLREKLINILDQAENAVSSDDNPDTLSEHISLVSEQIISSVVNLTPVSMHDIIMDSFPTPIALAYRKFHDSRFNVYEQLVRLRDLYEAIAFFIYNVSFADWVYRLSSGYLINDRSAVKAYSDFSMHSRIKFVDHILKIAKNSRKDDLFLSELIDTEYSSLAFALQSEFRNFFSHHGLGSEVVVKNSLNKFWPMVQELLTELRFLADYRMARITEVYSHKKSLVQRMELYRGPVPEIDEVPIEQNAIPALPDKEHIVLLDQDNRSLSLYPVYQLFYSEETRFEKHICFLKQVKDQKIQGESVQGAFPVVLDGSSELLALVTNAINKK